MPQHEFFNYLFISTPKDMSKDTINVQYKDKQVILNGTNSGLDIIIDYYPNAKNCIDSQQNKKFKIRNEKTPSASLKQINGTWVVTDFGEDSKAYNAIDLVMKEEGLSFTDALKFISEKYKINGHTKILLKAEYKKTSVQPGEKDGEYYFKKKDKITDSELKYLGPTVTNDLCTKFNCYSIESYKKIKGNDAHCFYSTTDFPIFLFEYEEDGYYWKKLYKPYDEKQFKWLHIGEKPLNHVYGLKELREEAGKRKENGEGKIEKVIICSGERDQLNLASFGYWTLRLNSETADLPPNIYNEIRDLADEIHNIPDIDETGIRKGTELALKYYDILTIWLNYYFKDVSGKKDLTDYVKMYPKQNQVDILFRRAIQAKFWYKSKKDKWDIDNVSLYYFLSLNGFYTLKTPTNKNGFIFIRVTGNAVEEVTARDITFFIRKWAENKLLNKGVLNMLARSNQVKEASLTNLIGKELDFKIYSKQSQYFFFINGVLEVNKNSIQFHAPGSIKKHIWINKRLNNNYKPGKEPFKIRYDKNIKEYDIEVLDTSSFFFRYLINASRMFWRDELEKGINKISNTEKRNSYLKSHKFSIDGKLLKDEQIREQKSHLVNKIFAIGYLMHRHKDPSKAWMVVAMDNKMVSVSESHGGTGKSAFFGQLRPYLNFDWVDGKTMKLGDNKHKFERVTEHTDIIVIDDLSRFFKLEDLFSAVTSDMNIDVKGVKSYNLPFKDSPKIGVTTNYSIRDIDGSTMRRILPIMFSDYYHHNTNNEYNETRTIKDDLGIRLIDDYEEKNWQDDINFIVNCIRFYLSVSDKIEPPLDNFTAKSLISNMGENFKEWADTFFSDDSNFGAEHLKKDLMKHFLEEAGLSKAKFSAHRFFKAMNSYCDLKNYVFTKTDGKDDSNTTSEIYIITKTTEQNIDPNQYSDEKITPLKIKEDSKPF